MHGRDDIDAVVATETAYDAAWNAGDLDGLVDCFAHDAVLVNPRGEVAVGLAEIRTRLDSFLRGDGYGSRHTSRITRVSFATHDVAVIDGEASVDTPAPGNLTHRFTDILVRHDNVWKIAHVRTYDLQIAGDRRWGT